LRRAIVLVFAHTVHHSVVGDLLNNDVEIVTVQKLLGHASVQTTEQYERRGERAKQHVGAVKVSHPFP